LTGAIVWSIGLAFGVLGGFATHIRVGADGGALVRVGWIAGALPQLLADHQIRSVRDSCGI
jgi:hypothetical protein